jgi:hypothetical protein
MEFRFWLVSGRLFPRAMWFPFVRDVQIDEGAQDDDDHEDKSGRPQAEPGS